MIRSWNLPKKEAKRSYKNDHYRLACWEQKAIEEHFEHLSNQVGSEALQLISTNVEQ